MYTPPDPDRPSGARQPSVPFHGQAAGGASWVRSLCGKMILEAQPGPSQQARE